MNILLIGHHRELTALVVAALVAQYEVECVRSTREGLARLGNRWVGALVLVTGAFEPEPVAQLRAATTAPMVVVSDSDDVETMVAFLDAGADDYMGHPLRVPELLARLRAAGRRVDRGRKRLLVTPDFTLALERRRMIQADGTEVFFTRNEWTLMETLAERPGEVVDYPDLISAVWGSKSEGGMERLRMNLMAIRRKIEPSPGAPRYLRTVPGRGIFLDLDSDEPPAADQEPAVSSAL